jgi:hypothetical protein
MKSPEEKAAEAVVNAVSRVDFVPNLFAGHLRAQPYNIQRRIIETFAIYFKQYRVDADCPYLEFRTDPHAARVVESIDLTGFDN